MSSYKNLSIPSTGPNDSTALITQIQVVTGMRVAQGQLLLSVETSKSQIDVHADAEGWVQLLVAEGEIVSLSAPVVRIFENQKALNSMSTASVDLEGPKPSEERFTRKALKLIREQRLSRDLFAHLPRVTEKDVLKLGAMAAGTVVLPQSFRKRTEIELLEAASANRFRSSVTIVLNARVLEQLLREQLRKELHISPADFLCYHITKTITRFPALNAAYTCGGLATQHQAINPGFALNIADKGLKVPTIQNASDLDLLSFCSSLQELIARYLREELTPQELTSATFNITSLYSLGVHDFDPLIAAQQSSVFGISSPNALGDFKLILGFDHRLTDAMECVQFFEVLKLGMGITR